MLVDKTVNPFGVFIFGFGFVALTPYKRPFCTIFLLWLIAAAPETGGLGSRKRPIETVQRIGSSTLSKF
jgi:hypothetical protein